MITRRGFVQAASVAGALSATLRAAGSDPDQAKATDSVLAAIPLARSDPDRPTYHFHPPAQWTNDPNGTIFYKGWHHLFYQLNPFAARLGSQHWGHARSLDLVNWEHLPIAIWPSADKGERAIFSGGAAFASDGRPRILYTSIGHPQPEQWLAIPKDDDLLYWTKFPGNPVLSQSAHIAGAINQWRDPFLFLEGGVTYMVCGGGSAAGRAQVQLYRAVNEDLTSWKHLGAVFQSLDREFRNFECPNLFKLDGKWVLIVSPNRQCEYWVGDLDVGSVRFTPETHGVLDAGNAYASNISVDDQGRTILWMWGRTNTPQGKGWGSVITMPRILSIGSDGYLRQQPAPEFATLRGAVKTFPASTLDKPIVLDGVLGDVLEIEAEFSGAGTYGLELRRPADGQAGVTVSIRRGMLSVGNVSTYIGNARRYTLRVFLDKCCVEAYVNDGLAAIYNPFDANRIGQGVAVFGQAQPPGGPGGTGAPPPEPPRIEALKVWPMKAATFNLDRFHV